jgi:hypothetical protein
MHASPQVNTRFLRVTCFVDSSPSILKIDAVGSSETMIDFHPTTRGHNSEHSKDKFIPELNYVVKHHIMKKYGGVEV